MTDILDATQQNQSLKGQFLQTDTSKDDLTGDAPLKPEASSLPIKPQLETSLEPPPTPPTMNDVTTSVQEGIKSPVKTNENVLPPSNYPKKKKVNPAILIPIILIVITLPLIVIFVSQPKLIADIRSRAYVSKQRAQRLKEKYGITSKDSTDPRKIDSTKEGNSTGAITLVPTATPTLVPTATPTLVPTATPTLVPTATPTLVPTATPTLVPTATPTPIQTQESTDTVTPTPSQDIVYVYPTATPTPLSLASCNGACTINSNCGSGLVCIDGTCRNASCTRDITCSCGTPITPQPTPKTPVSGGPTVLGASVIGIGMLILILGFVL